METLKEFMLLFRMAPSNNQPTAEQIARMQQEWGVFFGGIASQAKLVNATRLALEGNIVDKTKSVKSGIFIVNNETLSGNMIVKAASLQEATEMAKGCPILALGGSVEVRSTIPMKS